MKTSLLHIGLAALAIGSLAAAQNPTPPSKPAQKPAAPEATDQPVQVYRLSHVIGLELKNDTDKSVGEIQDLVINCADGRIAYAVVSTGGTLGVGDKDHLVPWESVRCSRKDSTSTDCTARTTMTADQISKAPEFKKDEISKLTPPADRATGGDTGARTGAACLISANELKGADVRAADKSEYGEIEDVILAPEQGCVAYTVLASGGVLGMGEKKIALPWKTTEISRNPSDSKELVVRTPATKAQLEKAPEFVANDWNKMSSRTWMTDLYTYHSADPFWSHARPASAPKLPDNKKP